MIEDNYIIHNLSFLLSTEICVILSAGPANILPKKRNMVRFMHNAYFNDVSCVYCKAIRN